MTRLVTVLNILIRVFAAAALSLGLAFWFGYARFLTRLHIGLGTGLVACLRLLAFIVWRKSGRAGLAALAAAWGLVTWLFGFAHGALLPGTGHWVVAAAHLLLGGLTIAVGRQLANALTVSRVSPERSISPSLQVDQARRVQ